MNKLVSPKAGDVVKCWFPENEHIFSPGSKFRPVLVVEADDSRGRQELRVAYGTSQSVEIRRRGDFVVFPAELQLDKPTKLSLSRMLWLPLSPEYFMKDGAMEHLGTLPRAALQRLADAAKEGVFI